MKTILNTKPVSLLLLAIAFALIYNPWTKFPYTFCVIIIFILAVTYWRDGNLRNLHFHKLGSREGAIIVFSYLILELSFDIVIQPLVSYVCGEPADYSSFAAIAGDTSMYLKWLFRMWISAAIGEELLFRAFAFAQLERVIGNKKGWLILLSSVLFSLPHLYQGISGLVVTFLFGIAFAYLFARFRNIWVNIIVHGLIDTVFLTVSYLGWLDLYNLWGV